MVLHYYWMESIWGSMKLVVESVVVLVVAVKAASAEAEAAT